MLMRLATVAPKPSKRFASQLFMLELARTGSRVSSCIRPCGEANKLSGNRRMIVVLGGPHIRPDNLNLPSVVRDLYRFYRLTRPGELLRASHFIMTLWIMI